MENMAYRPIYRNAKYVLRLEPLVILLSNDRTPTFSS